MAAVNVGASRARACRSRSLRGTDRSLSSPNFAISSILIASRASPSIGRRTFPSRCHRGAPDFKPTFTGVEEPPDLAQLEGFRGLLIRFYREARSQGSVAKAAARLSARNHPLSRAGQHVPCSRRTLSPQSDERLHGPPVLRVRRDAGAPEPGPHAKLQGRLLHRRVTPPAAARVDEFATRTSTTCSTRLTTKYLREA